MSCCGAQRSFAIAAGRCPPAQESSAVALAASAACCPFAGARGSCVPLQVARAADAGTLRSQLPRLGTRGAEGNGFAWCPRKLREARLLEHSVPGSPRSAWRRMCSCAAGGRPATRCCCHTVGDLNLHVQLSCCNGKHPGVFRQSLSAEAELKQGMVRRTLLMRNLPRCAALHLAAQTSLDTTVAQRQACSAAAGQ